MCIEKVIWQGKGFETRPNETVLRWRMCRVDEDGNLTTCFVGTTEDNFLKLNEGWTKAKNIPCRGTSLHDPIKNKYPAGFHVFKTKKQAEAWAGFWGWGFLKIIKVECAGLLAKGETGNVNIEVYQYQKLIKETKIYSYGE